MHGPPNSSSAHCSIQVVIYMHMVGNGVVSFGVELEINTWVVLVLVGWSIWLGWVGVHHDANVVQISGNGSTA